MNKKIRNLFVAISGLFLSVGAAVGVGLNVDKGTKEAKAASVTTWEGKIVYKFKNGSGDGAPLDKGSTYFAYHYTDDQHRNGGWKEIGVTASYYDKNGDLTLVYVTNDTYAHLIFADNKGHQTTTFDCAGVSANWKNDKTTWTPETYTHYFYDRMGTYGNTVYAHAFTSGGEYTPGTGWPGVSMTSEPYSGGNLFSVTLDECFDKIMFNNNKDRQSCNDGGEANAWANGKECFACWNGNDRSGSWTGLDNAMADAWIYQYMHFRDVDTSEESYTGDCYGTDGTDGYFALAVDVYNSHLSDDVKTIISGYDDNPTFATVSARLSNWAAACGKTVEFKVEGGEYSIDVKTKAGRTISSSTTIAESSNNATLIIVIAISAVAIIAVGGYFFIRKRKEY